MFQKLRDLRQRLRLGYLVLAFLVVFGSVPILFNSLSTASRDQSLLASHEQEKLTQNTEILRLGARNAIEGLRARLAQAGDVLESVPAAVPRRTQSEWRQAYLKNLQEHLPAGIAIRVVDLVQGRAQRSSVPEIQEAMDAALIRLREGDAVEDLSLASGALGENPRVVISRGVKVGGELAYVIQGVTELQLISKNLEDVFLFDLDRDGEVLWNAMSDAEPVKVGLQQSAVVREFLSLPKEHDIIPVMEYSQRVGADETTMIGQATRLGDTGWAVVVQQPRSAAFGEVRRLIKSSLLSAGITIGFALLFAGVGARLMTRPIERLAKITQAVAKGEYGRKVEMIGFGSEMKELADSYNQMSDQVAHQVEQLKEAARLNRDLFIGSIRAFLAAVEAKEPYTRGHSERVASYSQVVAKYLNLSRQFQERIWIAGLLHDVGKIGIDDRVLKKGDKLTDEEYREMQRHAPMGAEIMASIEQLRDTLPAIRWHHEDWDGTGYPDGIRGEEIPLMARIVAVADTFDAITTQRVYQNPYTDEQALDIIRNLIGKRFDPNVANAFLRAFSDGEIRTLAARKAAGERVADDPAAENDTSELPIQQMPPTGEVVAAVVSDDGALLGELPVDLDLSET